ncbi:hypothetical protein HDU87_008357 [Geranomyces variabilis]|uniref:F-box domain-containing protein n=1 Tax=Geranomyces variabilis TaxID=109894 RepID=A0AAD5TE28_9FUNG|nr:hypothetical protein HDU87_008357 [Geranomyces variabilis]
MSSNAPISNNGLAQGCGRCRHAGRPSSEWESHRTAGSKLCYFFKGRKSASKKAKITGNHKDKDTHKDKGEDGNGEQVVTLIPVPQLPFEILERILSLVSDPETLLSLPTVCKLFEQIVNNKNQAFWQEWKRANSSLSKWLKHAPAHGAKRSVALMALRGCEICETSLWFDVYDFGVRCCYSCVRSHTICWNRLPYPLNVELLPLPYTSRYPGYGRFSKPHYWKAQLERYVQEHGCEDVHELADQMLAEKEHAMIKNIQERSKQRRKKLSEDSKIE